MAERLTIKGGRFYRVLETNEVFPSVTTVLSVVGKKFLPKWEAKLAVSKFRASIDERLRMGDMSSISQEELDTWSNQANNEPNVRLHVAGSFGTDAHVLFEGLLRRENVDVAPQFAAVAHNFVTWRDSLVPQLEVIENEKIV
jgi:hypothetical protein